MNRQEQFVDEKILDILNFVIERTVCRVKIVTMKIFHIIQKNFTELGLSKSSPFKRHLRGISISIFGNACVCVYFFHDAVSVEEHMLSFLTIIGGAAAFICFLSTIFNKTLLNDFVDDYQKFIDESK